MYNVGRGLPPPPAKSKGFCVMEKLREYKYNNSSFFDDSFMCFVGGKMMNKDRICSIISYIAAFFVLFGINILANYFGNADLDVVEELKEALLATIVCFAVNFGLERKHKSEKGKENTDKTK